MTLAVKTEFYDSNSSDICVYRITLSFVVVVRSTGYVTVPFAFSLRATTLFGNSPESLTVALALLTA